MGELDFPRVEGDTAAGVLQGTVEFVACNGAAEVGQVDADLVLASGFEADFNEGIGLVSGDYFVGGDGPALSTTRTFRSRPSSMRLSTTPSGGRGHPSQMAR